MLALLALLLLSCRPDPAPKTRESGLPSHTGAESRDETVESVPGDTSTDTTELRISEVVADNGGSLSDAAGGTPDWIELYNPGPAAVELARWGLSDDPDSPAKLVLPARLLQPGAFLIVLASGETSGATGEIHAPFKLDAKGETLILTRPDGSEADRLEIPPLEEDLSYGLAQTVIEQILVAPGDLVRWTAAPPEGWREPDFDDSEWAEGLLPLGYDLGGGGGTPENVALFQTTTQSSDGYGFTGAQATDGESSTFSHTGDGDLTPWWQVALPEEDLVSSIVLVNRADCCPERLYNLSVELLLGEKPVWTSDVLNPVAEGGTPASPGPSLTLTLPEGQIGDAVRVSKVAVGGASSSEWLSLAEVVVMAVPAAPYANDLATDLSAALYGVSDRLGIRVALDPVGAADRAFLSAGYDDGFAASIDGLEVARSAGFGGTEAHEYVETESFDLDPTLLPPKGALLALELSNVAADDPDLFLAPTLSAQVLEEGDLAYFDAPTPGAPNGAGFAGFVDNPLPDHPRGFYDAPFTLSLSAPEATLSYTLDGSEPSLEHGVLSSGGEASVEIETTTLLRARAFREGYAPSELVTHTYLFLQDVIRQPATPAGFPTTWVDPAQGSFTADYEMDPEIVDDPAYHDELLEGLRAIPTLSLVTDPEALFGEEDGIYVHSLERGDEWERPASVELILPDGSTAFQVDCGLRLHGYGWRYHSVTMKHSLRLEFRSEYGPSKLEYPLFPDSPVERFDSIVLRSQGSKGWQDFRDPEQTQYLHDAFARDTAREMGKIDGHATFVHLYLNGLYWGLYNPVERPEAAFGEEYLGGDDSEYDAINRRTSTNEAVNGTLDEYNRLLALADLDLRDPTNYAAVAEMLDLDDLVDTMLIHQYMTNRDGPCCFEHNNMRGLRRRAEGERFRFFVWDMEYSLWEADDVLNVDVDVSGAISHVYARLRENADFRELYSEHAWRHLSGDGALTPESAAARYASRALEIEQAVVAESARWGDAKREPPYTRDIEWVAERDRLLEEYFPARTAALIEQLQDAGLMERD